MKITERYKRKTPSFFRKLRNIGIALATAGGVIIAAPISLPAIVITVATAVSQAVVSDNESDQEQTEKISEKINL